jgi:hypothetical protein
MALKPGQNVRLRRCRDPRDLRCVQWTRLGRAVRSALHPRVLTRLVGATVLVMVASFVAEASAGTSSDSTGTVVGWVRDCRSGQPLESALVQVFGSGFPRRVGAWAVTDREGRFEFHVTPGVWSIEVHSLYHEPGRNTVVVDPARADTLSLPLLGYPVVDGVHVVPGRRPKCP